MDSTTHMMQVSHFARLSAHGAVALALFTIVGGCRYDAALSGAAVEEERLSILAQYMAEREDVLNREYTLDTAGDGERCRNLLNLTTNTYNKVLRWRTSHAQTEAERSSIDAIKRYCDLWISSVDKEYEYASGSYSGIFHADEWMIIYNKAIRRLLMNKAEAARWSRIESMTWPLHGKRITFVNGRTCVKLPWRLFKTEPYLADFDWVAFIDEESVFSAKGADYAVVWFAGKGNLVGCPTTTEERVLVEVKGKNVSRCVGMHNILGYNMSLSQAKDHVTITSSDGYGKKVNIVIDLETMKIVESMSTLPSEFTADGYDKKFVADGGQMRK